MKQTTPSDNDYWAVKARIDTALETLRRDLRQMHEQDLVLFRQLMTIHSTIYRMSGQRRDRRSYEDETEGNMAIETQRRRKPPLNRGCSAPVSLPNILDEEDTDEESEVDEKKNFLAQSFSSTEPTNHNLTTPVSRNAAPLPVPFCHELHIVSPPSEKKYHERSQPAVSPGPLTTSWIETASQSPAAPPVSSSPKEDTETPEREHNNEGGGTRKWKGSWDDGDASSKRRVWYSILLKRSCQIWKTVQQDHNDREIFI